MANNIPLDLESYNYETIPKLVEFKIYHDYPFVPNASDYEVYVKSAEIPISKTLPVYLSTNDMSVFLEATDKDNKSPIFPQDKLFLGLSLGDKIASVAQFCDKLNQTALYPLGENHMWCKFFASDHKMVMEVIPGIRHDLTKIWIDMELYPFFEGLPRRSPDTTIMGVKCFELYSQTNPGDPWTYTQPQTMVPTVANLKSFTLLSTLPIAPHHDYNQNRGEMTPTAEVGSVIYNSKEMMGNVNLIYIPQLYDHVSLLSSGDIRNIRVWVIAHYATGVDLPVYMDQGGYVKLKLRFKRIKNFPQ